ncbi:hypothetical protein QLL95_gp1258 [Cotonvirus japonicus]|uniref:Uncharacterized protein n=1 Tax=Cotonvirus japonicus TaxID=2811091 RepID=A0ABM7NRS0_9VIRU|nr:hypothetical protein QLL95_gp1258 [Cotonvirus japonicus]BCS82865.1 hypothetical protein [Cotonvirus japonicus]
MNCHGFTKGVQHCESLVLTVCQNIQNVAHRHRLEGNIESLFCRDNRSLEFIDIEVAPLNQRCWTSLSVRDVDMHCRFGKYPMLHQQGMTTEVCVCRVEQFEVVLFFKILGKLLTVLKVVEGEIQVFEGLFGNEVPNKSSIAVSTSAHRAHLVEDVSDHGVLGVQDLENRRNGT